MAKQNGVAPTLGPTIGPIKGPQHHTVALLGMMGDCLAHYGLLALMRPG